MCLKEAECYPCKKGWKIDVEWEDVHISGTVAGNRYR